MKEAFVSWSGGKDCCQAAYQAAQQGYQIRYLLNMVTTDAQRSCSHGISAHCISLQSAAMEIPIIQQPTRWDNYEAVFIETLRRLRNEGITTGVFGDIDFTPHREWNERVCSMAGITPFLPLWQGDQNLIAREFINLGFESIVVATQSDLLGRGWLGRRFDNRFLQEIASLTKNISPCGEAGEFHTLVVDGPLFKQRLKIQETEKVQRDNHWFLDIKKCELGEKRVK